ncbi:MAG: CoA protein activase [Ruminiclostridium sp.]|nr:CoA protein activase [Ruminiclostridium sp.]
MKITFPHLGNTYICVKALLDDLGVQYVIPPFNNKKGLELGTKYVPEMACLPLKINIGNYIQAYRQGADTILMAGGCGPCRFGYYCEMHREIMRDIGYEMDIITLEMINGNVSELFANIKKLAGGTSPLNAVIATIRMIKIAKQVDEIEMLAFKIRPREKIKGSTDDIYKDFRNKVFLEKGCRRILALISRTREELLGIDTDKSFQPLKIGIVGEIYTTIEHSSSFDIQNRLGNMGVEVDRQVTVSGWIIEHILKKAFHLPRKLEYAKEAKPYLATMIGGHAQETLGHTVLYSKKGYDGVIQIFPLSCMPEIVAESILPKVQVDFGIPVLTLIIDEMTGEAGYLTRVEAFIDLLKKRREQRNDLIIKPAF